MRGEKGEKSEGKDFGRPVGGRSSQQQAAGRRKRRRAECRVRVGAREHGAEHWNRKGDSLPRSLLSYTLARVHRGGEMSSWRGREMRGGAVRVCVECGRWRASVGRLEEKRDTGRERETKTEGRGGVSTAVFASVPLTSPPGSTWYRLYCLPRTLALALGMI
jgi:hypothetical protein